MADDVENTINNFLIEASALRASQEMMAKHIDQQNLAIAALTDRIQKTQLAMADQAQHDLVATLHPSLSSIEVTAESVTNSINAAAVRAAEALTQKLQEVEAAKSHGMMMIGLTAVVASFATYAFIYAAPAFLIVIQSFGART
jgi:hypothetical protein